MTRGKLSEWATYFDVETGKVKNGQEEAIRKLFEDATWIQTGEMKEVILDFYKALGYDPDMDRDRFTLTTSGITIVAKKSSVSKESRKD